MARRAFAFEDRCELAVMIKAGCSDRDLGEALVLDWSLMWRERRRNSTKTKGYRPQNAERLARVRRKPPQARKIDANPVLRARVMRDLSRSRTLRQVAGRLHLEATDASVGVMTQSPPAEGHTVSHEAIYRWIYAMPRGELAREAILLRSKRTQRKPRRVLGERTGGRIIGMVSIDDRPESASDRRVPGAWEGDLMIGKGGKTAIVTMVERHSRFVIILGLPDGKDADSLCDVLIDRANDLPTFLKGSLTWDQGTEMARHASLTVATNLPVYFAHPRSPWERPSNENTNGLIREYLPKGIDLTNHQPYLNAIADELNDRPRAALGFLTPREVMTNLLNSNVA